ncbi:GNAT domain-containing protein [Phaeosphaeria sp. MPI-PUGE-AT-0046c]|nr:GNAT domain-containing protein [Phaeosphaeria sp. MPI-PUGE-AT-0046c]
MEPEIITPRLKLTLVTSAERGSPEFDWIHELRSNKQSSWWSLYGPSKSEEDTERALKNIMAAPHVEGEDKVWKIAYAVHELLSPANADTDHGQSRFIGLASLRSLSEEEIKAPPHDTHGSTDTRLSLELAYMFLPTSWGKGYATESVSAMLEACGRVPVEYWAPYKSAIVRAIVHDENLPSQRVMEKCGMSVPKVLEFEGGRFFIAGKWWTKHRLFVYERNIGA